MAKTPVRILVKEHFLHIDPKGLEAQFALLFGDANCARFSLRVAECRGCCRTTLSLNKLAEVSANSAR